MGVIKLWNRLPRNPVDSSPLKIFGIQLDKVLGNLNPLWSKPFSARSQARWSPEVPDSLNYSMILWCYEVIIFSWCSGTSSALSYTSLSTVLLPLQIISSSQTHLCNVKSHHVTATQPFPWAVLPISLNLMEALTMFHSPLLKSGLMCIAECCGAGMWLSPFEIMTPVSYLRKEEVFN